MQTKKCSKCSKEKPVSEFYKDRGRKDGLYPWCSVCKKAHDKNHSRYAGRKKEWRAKIRKIVIQHYGSKCVCCGESRYEFLALDHKNGGGNQHRREVGFDITRWIYKNDFPPIFQILCHNCNTAKGCYGYCPHEREVKNEKVANSNRVFGTSWEGGFYSTSICY